MSGSAPSDGLIDPRDPLERQNEKLRKITDALMRRVEQGSDGLGAAFAQFQRAALLEEEVTARTRELGRALDLLNASNARLAEANRETEAARRNLTNAIETVQEGFALFSAEEELVLSNSRFGLHMPDIRDKMQPGLRFSDYVELVSRSQFLALSEGETPEKWAARRMERHQDRHVIFNARMVWNRWVQVSEHRTPDGGTVILQTDVTDIMRLERRERDRMLDTQAKLIRATLDHLDQGVCIFDDQARLVGWNQRAGELLSLPVGKLRMGASFAALFERFRDEVRFSGDTTAETIADWVRMAASRPALSFEMHHHNGRLLTASAQEMPDRGFVMSFSDVSAERAAVQAVYEANERLEQRVIERTLELEDALSEAERANASKSRFVAAASHDLLQPLSAAKLYVGSALAEAGDAKTQSVLSRAGNALNAVEHILGALLDISKLDSGQAGVHLGQVHLGRMLAQLCDELAPQAEAKGLHLRLVGCDVTVQSDATYLRRILQNLIGNAVRYTQRGKVLVGVRRQGANLRVEVHDTGPGIPADQQELIFKEFHRGSGTSSAAEGLGLGLAIVDRACAVLNHPLTLHSDPGRGTCFAVEVPASARRLPDVPAPAKSAEQPASDDTQLEDMVVLLVEKDQALRDALSTTMEQWGVIVWPATDLDSAQQQQAEFGIAPDAVIAGQTLRDGQHGVELIQHIRRSHGALPACLLSGRGTDAGGPDAGGLDQPQLPTETAPPITVLHKPLSITALHHFLLQTYQQVQRR